VTKVLNYVAMCSTYTLAIQNVQLRYLCPTDIPVVKNLCVEWFPIDYPNSWYEDITSNPKFYSLAATLDAQIIGIIVAEIKSRSRCNKEDSEILSSQFPPSSQLAYILSLGVVKSYRCNGIASLLLENLLSYLTSGDQNDCKAVYLHVLTSNKTALQFYERRQFNLHSYLPYYYLIKGTPKDGLSYVLYINGGQPPWSFHDYFKYIAGYLVYLKPCMIANWIMSGVCNLCQRIMKYPPIASSSHLS